MGVLGVKLFLCWMFHWYKNLFFCRRLSFFLHWRIIITPHMCCDYKTLIKLKYFNVSLKFLKLFCCYQFRSWKMILYIFIIRYNFFAATHSTALCLSMEKIVLKCFLTHLDQSKPYIPFQFKSQALTIFCIELLLAMYIW